MKHISLKLKLFAIYLNLRISSSSRCSYVYFRYCWPIFLSNVQCYRNIVVLYVLRGHLFTTVALKYRSLQRLIQYEVYIYIHLFVVVNRVVFAFSSTTLKQQTLNTDTHDPLKCAQGSFCKISLLRVLVAKLEFT